MDVNECYRDFPGEIGGGKSVEILAREVIRGGWGNGDDRKARLSTAGYDYDEVQNRVNEILLGVKN